MQNLTLVLAEGEPEKNNKKVIVDGLLSHHASNGHVRPKPLIFSIFLKDAKNKIYGGVIASILWNGMHLDALWVDPSLIKQGWGSKLVLAAEEEAQKRGVTISYTDTFTWQAPKFYEKLGYKLYGKLEDFPAGSSLMYFCKKI
jgi:ribosomal protein S18 acetylase RimI-like enzyme